MKKDFKYYEKEYRKKHLTRVSALEAARQSEEKGVLRVPDGKKVLDNDFAYFVVRDDLLPHIRKLIIPASVTQIQSMSGDPSSGPYGYRNNPFEEIVVEERNPVYVSRDGVLFTKNMRELICYPCGKPGKEYHVPEGVEIIHCEAFLNVEHLEKVYLPDSVETVETLAFCGYRKLDFPEIAVIREVSEDRYLFELRSPQIWAETEDDAAAVGTESIFFIVDHEKILEFKEDAAALLENMELPRIEDYSQRIVLIEKLMHLANDEYFFGEGDLDDLCRMILQLEKCFYDEQY